MSLKHSDKHSRATEDWPRTSRLRRARNNSAWLRFTVHYFFLFLSALVTVRPAYFGFGSRSPNGNGDMQGIDVGAALHWKIVVPWRVLVIGPAGFVLVLVFGCFVKVRLSNASLPYNKNEC